jgi:hypothetical protein
LDGFSDTVAGLEADFRSFNLPSLLNIGFNIPTGNPAWETQQSASIIPTEFIDSGYRGRGFGMSALYGLSLPAGGEEYGIAAGYLYSGAFNPTYGQVVPAELANEQLKLGDSVFLSLNRVAAHGKDQSDILRFSAFYFLPTQVNGQDLLQMGPNLNASYSWLNSGAFSFEVGGQYFFPQLSVPNQTQLASNEALGTRFYLYPSYAFGNFTLAARAKYILPNGEPQSGVFYDGGGYLLGLEPSLRLKLDQGSTLRFSLSLDTVTSLGGGYDAVGNRVDIQYGYCSFGTDYEVHL